MGTATTHSDPVAATAAGRAKPSACALELLGIVKSYGPVKVLHGLDLKVRKGSIHALLGANGAGKSTLLKIAVGATTATAGRLIVNGQETQFAAPLDARAAGIGMVFQERSLVPQLSVVDNIFLNSEVTRAGLVRKHAQRRETQRMFEELGVGISPDALCGELSIADQQMVEIAKAVRLANSVLILDEPTAALTEREVARLFEVVRKIASNGVGIIYVSHRLTEIFDLCDEVTIIRDGRVVLSKDVPDTGMDEVVEAIAGAPVQHERVGNPARGVAGKVSETPVLEVKDLQLGTKLRSISFDLKAGEVLGVAGLAGSGRSTLLKTLFGLIHRNGGDIRIAGRSVKLASPGNAISKGIYLIPEDRKTQGLVLSHAVSSNLVMSILNRLCAGPLLSGKKRDRIVSETVAKFRIHPPDPSKIVEWLSGGNQQKVVLGKAFNARGRVLLLDEPTYGVDIHSRAEIHAQIREFVEAGNGAIWVTSDLRELAEVADRILLLVDGKVSEIVSNSPQRTEAEITHLIQGSKGRDLGFSKSQ